MRKPRRQHIDPADLEPGQPMDYRRCRVHVGQVNRFYRKGRLVMGSMFLRGDPAAAEPRDLFAFCREAFLPTLPDGAREAIRVSAARRKR